MKERYKFISAVYLLLIKENQILLLKRANTGYEDGNYSLVAGHIDGNETPCVKKAIENYQNNIIFDNFGW